MDDNMRRRRVPYGSDHSGEQEELTVQETATYLGRSIEQVRRYLRDGALVGYRVGQQWFVPRQSLDQFRVEKLGAEAVKEREMVLREIRAMRAGLLKKYGYLDAAGWVAEAREGLS